MLTVMKNDAKIENRGTLMQTNNEKFEMKAKGVIYCK